jgi:hypothetical protein
MLLSMLRRRSARTFLTVAFGLSLATPALSETLYRWKTDDGSVGYADDLKRVPERFRKSAEAIATGSLATYSRFTQTDPEADKAQAANVADRLQRLRELNAGLDRQEVFVASREAAASSGGPMVRIGSDDGSPVYVPTGDGGDGPLVVEEKRYRIAGSFVTRHDTIVRRGDKIIAIYKPRPHVVGTTSTIDIQDEAVLERR